MAFLMEYLRHKIAERMQSNEDLDEFWHNRINRNKVVAKKWVHTYNQPVKTYGSWKSEYALAKYRTNLDPGIQSLPGRQKAIDE